MTNKSYGVARMKIIGMRIFSFGFLIINILSFLTLQGCKNKDSDVIKQASGINYKAVYLMTENRGVITKEDLKQHPEVLTANTFQDLDGIVKENKIIEIWIDKDAIDLIEQHWLNEEPQKHNMIVVVGYDNSTYSFHEKLGLLEEGPKIDWSKEKVGNGFSIWFLSKETPGSINARVEGYSTTPTVKGIFDVTDKSEEKPETV